jgi:hypothetical protein
MCCTRCVEIAHLPHLHRFNVTPIPFPNGQEDLFYFALNNFDHGGHAYHLENNAVADWLFSEASK